MSKPGRTAILGWGSLIWDPREDFDAWHEQWNSDGPILPIEFSRISSSRDDALTLVIDSEHGVLTPVGWCLSKRASLADAVGDLRCREGTTDSQIGRLPVPDAAAGEDPVSIEGRIANWARELDIQAVVWTKLASNFERKKKMPFSVANAILHLQSLQPTAKVKAAEYVWRAPDFVRTPLRAALEVEPWFALKSDETRGAFNGR